MAVSKMDPEKDFVNDGDEPYLAIFQICKDYYDKYQSTIPPDPFVTEVEKRFHNDPNNPVWQYYFDFVCDLANEAFLETKEEELAPQYVIEEVLQPWLDQRVTNELSRLNTINTTAKDLVESLTKTVEESRVLSTTDYQPTQLSVPEVSSTVSTPAVPTGCKVFDALVGGRKAGHFMGILAPSGGGKTLLGLETAVRTAEGGEPVVFFSYETPVLDPPELRDRFWACASGVPMKTLAGSSLSDLPKSTQNDISKSVSALDKKIFLYDMSGSSKNNPNQGCGGVEEIEVFLNNLIELGIHPSLVVIDWLGAMVQRYMIGKNLDMTKDKYPTYQRLTHGLRPLSARYNVQVLLTHQLRAEAGSKGVRGQATQYDALDFRSFANYMDGCIVFTKPDIEDRAKVFTDKMRGDKSERYIQLDGNKGTIRLESGHWMPIKDHANKEYWVKMD